jgi:uncharacterized sodium:solute symporter family permease YidK
MRSTYRVLAFIIALEVVVQAAMMAFAAAGLFIWIDKDGGVLDKATLEAEPDFTGAVGFMIHGINGMMIIPLIALIFLIVSFFAKIPGGVKWAATVFGLVVLQVLLGVFGHESPYLGLLHGVNALAVLGTAINAGKRVETVVPAPTSVAA